MKKSALFIISLIIISAGYAQTDNKNVVKIFPTSFLFGKATLGYERVLNDNSSFTLNIGLPSGISPSKYVSFEETEWLNLIDGKLDGFLLMPGYRFNFSKKGAPLGFYIEPYLKYEEFSTSWQAEFIDDENERFLSSFDGSYSGLGVGIQMGFLFLIGDVVSIEWSFFGLEAKTPNAEIKYTDLSGGADIDDVYVEIAENFSSDIPVIGDKIEFEKGSNYVKGIASDFILPGFRSAISIGIAF